MRAAAILGLGTSAKELRAFQIAPGNPAIGMPRDASEADAILIFGGDGTVHRHLSDLERLKLPVLVVPCGSGNDFARALGLKTVRDSVAAWRKFISSAGQNVREIDLGIITEINTETNNGGAGAPARATASTYFCCAGGVGLDGEVARRANRLPRWLRGHGGYALALPFALAGFRPQKLEIQIADDNGHFVSRQPLHALLAAFANTQVYGGGMRIAPNAEFDDGKLDLVIVGDIAKSKLATLFPSVYFGRHLGIRGVESFKTKAVRIRSEHPLDVYADGEYVCRTPVEVGVQYRALRVIVG